MSNAWLYCKFSFKNRTEISYLEEHHHLTFNVLLPIFILVRISLGLSHYDWVIERVRLSCQIDRTHSHSEAAQTGT